jgi:hypothetical protein
VNILQNFLQNVAGKNHKEGLTEFLKDKLCKNLFSEKKKKKHTSSLYHALSYPKHFYKPDSETFSHEFFLVSFLTFLLLGTLLA